MHTVTRHDGEQAPKGHVAPSQAVHRDHGSDEHKNHHHGKMHPARRKKEIQLCGQDDKTPGKTQYNADDAVALRPLNIGKISEERPDGKWENCFVIMCVVAPKHGHP